jgi:hypothetical protein
MNILPLPRPIYDAALALQVTKITLNFSGGNDEGFLCVGIDREKSPPSDDEEAQNQFKQENRELEKKVEEWAFPAYSYSGAGCGDEYGDDICYDLIRRTVEHTNWMCERVDGCPNTESLTVENVEKPSEDSTTASRPKGLLSYSMGNEPFYSLPPDFKLHSAENGACVSARDLEEFLLFFPLWKNFREEALKRLSADLVF